MADALINPLILKWARSRRGLNVEELAKKLNLSNSSQILLWEKDEEKPTFIQVQKLANILHIPFGYFYLDSIPEEKLPIPDLRTIDNQQKLELSSDIYDLIKQIEFKQDWYRDYLIEEGYEALNFVGKYTVNTSASVISQDITKQLHLTIDDRKQVANWEEFLRLLIDKCEHIGIWVMRNGIVGNNTHRPLSVSEFRGFAIFDPIVPIVFLNGKDAKAAQIFTLIHELAHIWIGESGISDLSIETQIFNSHTDIEKLCNQVAAEVLVPREVFEKHWNNIGKIDKLASFFRVSSVVIARRAFDLGYIDWEEFRSFYNEEKEKWKLNEKKKNGGNFNYTLPIRYGQNFTECILRASINGKIMLRDAGRLLGTKPSKLYKLAISLGIA